MQTKTNLRAGLALRGARRGVSLVEALVALVVMAVGMLALTQVQVQLRLNAEITRQRAEAVRFAQEEMERWRSFSKLAGSAEGAYAFIASSGGPVDVTSQENVNTVYRLTRDVVTVGEPGYKALSIKVEWLARNGETYNVQLNSAIGQIDPTLQAQLSNPPPDSAVRSPFNRNIRIPTTAVDLGGGKSGFMPPGQSTGYYVFSNNDARTIEYCTGSLSLLSYEAAKNRTSSDTCEGRSGYFYSGFVNVDLRNNISAISPGSTICNLYQDMQAGGFLSTVPTLWVSNVQLDRASLQAPREYFANVLSINASTPADYSVSVSAAGNIVVTLGSNTNTAFNDAYFGNTSGEIVLRVKNGSDVERFRPNLVNGKSVRRSEDNFVYTALAESNKQAVLTIDPTNNLASNTVYELVIPGSLVYVAKNATVDTNTSPITLTFSTGTTPTLVSTSPSDNAVVSAVTDNITMTFDRNVVGGTGIVTLYKKNNGNSFSPIETFNVATGLGGSGGSIAFSGATVTINPGADLVNGAQYSIGVEPNAIKDTNGFGYAGISDNTTFNFDSPTAIVNISGCPVDSALVLPFFDVQFQSLSSSTGSAQSVCYSDYQTAVSETTTATIGYFCVVYLPTDTVTPFTWSGVPKLRGPSGWLTGGAARYKVCRYHDLNNDGSDTKFEHPASYTGVGESITDQNFLIIKNNRNCPNDTLNVGSQTGVVVYFNTAQFQP